jgi:asparagine synthase (glutamine-hydrolysing)
MCGFAGLVGDGRPDDDVLQRAAAVLRHRGPDELRTWADGDVGVAHARLAVIDRARGQQPLVSHAGRFVTVFNGEIYNHRELRTTLERDGSSFATACDTEVLPSLYAVHGPAMVERLQGMFAFAIVDRVRDEVFCARDRFGKKPLYFTPVGSGLGFASTLDALLPFLPSRPPLDPEAIAAYLVLQYVPDRSTPWDGVEKLEPGTWMRWRRGNVERRRYWTPPLPKTAVANGWEPRELRARIRDAVAARLESEVPLGVFLSGGLDSSVIVAELADLGVRAQTFSVGFSESRFDETRFAELVADRFGTDHRVLRPESDVGALFDALCSKYDEPFADSSALATLAVARAAKPHVTVVLTGDGGDELFGGYDRYRAYAFGTQIRRRLGPFASVGARAGRTVGRLGHLGRMEVASSFVSDPWVGYRDRLFHFSPAELPDLLQPGFLESIDPASPVHRLDHFAGALDGTRWVPWVDAQTYLPDDLLTKMDRATMSVGVEARSPFLDHRLWSYVATLPRNQLLRAREGKVALRRAYRELLPGEVLTRPKMGFGVPLATWLRVELRQRVDELLLSRGPIHDIARPDAVRGLVDRLRRGDDAPKYRVWNLLALAGWLSLRGGHGR